jgi:hypothetical protein
MKIWQAIYQESSGAEEERYCCETLGAAARYLCGLIVTRSIPDCDIEDQGHQRAVQKFFSLIDLGAYDQAIAHWQQAIETEDWPESVEICEVELFTEAHVELLADVAAIRDEWSKDLTAQTGLDDGED